MPRTVEVVGEGTYTFPDDATDDEIQEALSQPVAPPARTPSPAGSLPPGGVPPLAGGAALPGSLVPQVMPAANPLRTAMLGRQMLAGGAPLASMGPAAVQAAGAAAMPPIPPTQGPALLEGAPQALASGAVDVAQSAASLPRVTARLGEGLADAVLGEAAGALVRKLGAIAPQRLAGDFLEEKAIKPAAEFYEGGEAARRDAREAPLGEKLTEPGWALRQGLRQIPQLATSLGSAGAKGASIAGRLAAPFVMEAGEASRNLEEEEARTGKPIDNLRFGAAVAGKGAVNAGLELAGAEAILGRLTKFLPASVKKTLGRNVAEFLTGSVGEGLTERGQQVVGNFSQMMATDPPENWTDLAARARTPEFWQELDKGGAEAQFLGSFIGTGATAISSGSRAADVRDRAARMADRRAWRAEEGPARAAAPTPSPESGPGRGTWPQETIDAINEGVRALQNPETADEGLRRLKIGTAALDAQLRSLKSRGGMVTNEPQAPAPGEPPLRPQPPSRPISIDQLLGAQALPGVVKETTFRDQTAGARDRNVQAAVAGEERQRIANTPGAALRMILGDDPAFTPAPPAAEAGGTFRKASMPVLDWIDQKGQEIDEDRRTTPPEEWSHDESRYFALTDPGTGLANRQAYEIATRQSPEAAHAVLDVDKLKKFNDAFGHEAGDEYLSMVGLAARQNGVRLFRVGGDEFTAVHDGDEADLQKMLETARTGLQGTRVPGKTAKGEEYPLHQGFSYGTGRDFKTADARAYEDKRRREARRAAGANPEAQSQPVGVGRSEGPEAAPGPGNPAGVPSPFRKPGDDSGNSGAPPAGPASLPPPVTPPAVAAAAPNPEPSAATFTRTGKDGEAFTADGERVGVKWAVVDAFDELVPSHTITLEPNPAFAQVLQPRNRERVASEDQVESMARDIRPGALGENFNASDGAPIVGPDRLVESGNGRTIALQRAFRSGRADGYRAWLEEHAADFGLTPEDVRTVKNPVLVRVRTTPTTDRAELVKKFNVATVATMSASETAAADADRLTPEMLARFEPGDGGNAILAVRNRGFVEKFFSSVPANERGRLIDSAGELSQDGVRRIQNALMAKAYGASPVLERLAESTDDNIKTVSAALSNAAPGMAAVKAGIAKGDILPLDPTPAIIEAAAKLSHLRDTKTTVADFLDQTGLFGDEMSSEGREFLRAFEDFKRSGKRLSEFLTSLSESLITEGGAKQENLFGESETPRLENFIRSARKFVSSGGGQLALIGGEEDPGGNGPKGSGPEGISPRGPAGGVGGSNVREEPSSYSPEQLDERAEQALVDLGGDRGGLDLVGGRLRGLEGAGIRTRADAFAGVIRRRGGIDFRGIEVKTPEDLAVAARVVRDPRLETLRIFYVKSGRIVGHEAWSSRLPAGVDFRSGRMEKLADDIKRRMIRFQADGYYTLHNHPSGDPTPSSGDDAFTRKLSTLAPGLLASVVIDSNRYGLVTNRDTRGGAWQSLTLNVSRENVVNEDRSNESGLYDRITNHEELAAAGKRFHKGETVATVFYQDAKLRVTGIQDVPTGRLLGRGAVEFFRGQLRRFGATGMAAYFPLIEGAGPDGPWIRRDTARTKVAYGLLPLFRAGMLHEAIGENLPSVRNSGRVETPIENSMGLSFGQAAARRVGEERDVFGSEARPPRSSSAEDRIYDAMVARARSRATAAAEAAERVRAELEDPGDVMEARRDRELPEHSREVQNHIRPAGNRETVTGLLNPFEARYQEVVRRHYAVEKAGERMGTKAGPAHRDPGVVAELAAGHSARAEQMLAGNGGFKNGADGNIEWTGNRALETILGDLGPGRLNELRRYLVARRAIELHHRTSPQQGLGATRERTIYSGITEAAAQKEVAGAPADIKKAAEEITALLDDALRYWADAGGLSPAAVDVIRDMNRAYVPFYRIFEGKDPGKQGRLVLPAKRGAALQSEQAVKTIFGSQRDILDPLVAVADHIQRMIRAADLNRVGKTLVEAAALNPEAAYGLVEEVATGRNPSEGVTNEGKAVQDAAGNFGVEVDDEAASALSFLSDKKLSYADDRIKVWQNGKLKEYRVAREIGESLRALGPEEMKFFGKAVIFPSRLLRGGVTKNPIFQLHNFLRDTADASVQTQNGFIPVLDSIRGFKEALKDGELRREWLAAGGGFATLSGGGLKGAEKTIREIAPRTRAQSVLRTVIHPLEALSTFGRPFEEAARLGEYRKARLAGKSATEGALEAARVTTNFTVHGADAHFWWLAKASAFTNPAIQGADKAFRTILEAPRGEAQSAGRIARASAAVAVRGLLNVSMLSAVLYALNYDDDEIEELRKTKAGAVWWFMRVPGTNTIFRIPKPFLWGQVFGTGMETILDRARGENPDAMKRWGTEVLEMLSDNVFPIPTPAKLTGELWANRSIFFKRPIVPRGLENAEPEMQVTPRTGETARRVGKLASGLPDVGGLGVVKSPAKLEYLVGGLGGTLGREALRASDTVMRDPGTSPPERHLSELPLVGRAFATGGTTGTYSIERFWREADKVRTAKTTLREKMKSDPAGAREYGREHKRELVAGSTYEDAAERLGDLRKGIEAIRKAPDSRFTPAEKTRRIDALEARINDVAKKIVSRDLLQENER